MRILVLLTAVVALGCGGSGNRDVSGAPGGDTGGSSGDPGTSSGGFSPRGDGGVGAGDGGVATTSTLIYANTDDTLYTLDPATNAVTVVGAMSGADGNVTDCAVNAEGELYVNSATTIYRATLPGSGKGSVALKKVASIGSSAQKFFALAFAPPGVLGTGETLVGGDDVGELWAIDATTGATKRLGGFGSSKTGVYALSGDVVFYTDASGKPTGLATIRACKSGGTSCTTNNDFLAGIDMAALTQAYASGTPAKSLLAGIYGGSAAGPGPGINGGELFGLGAWEGNVYGFERASANNGKPALLLVDTNNGTGTRLPSTETFTNGWSGACVTTKVTVTVPAPPPGPN